jgi:hypothetical protein
MRVERIRPTVLQVTLSAYELSALVAGARWAVEGAEGDLPPEAVEQLRQVLARYDAALAPREPARAPSPPAGAGG